MRKKILAILIIAFMLISLFPILGSLMRAIIFGEDVEIVAIQFVKEYPSRIVLLMASIRVSVGSLSKTSTYCPVLRLWAAL